MYLEEFLKSTNNLAELQKALSILHNINFFSVLLELSHKRSGALTGDSNNIIEAAAMQRGVGAGYYLAIEDLFNFQKIFQVDAATKTVPDYGASKVLKDLGFNEEEIKDARQQSREHSQRSK